MSKFKGTKGKWTRYQASLMGSDKKASHSVYVGTKRIALCYDLFETDKSKNVDELEAEFNTKLIVCAPEMLNQLENIVKEYDLGIVKGIDVRKIRELIKSATT